LPEVCTAPPASELEVPALLPVNVEPLTLRLPGPCMKKSMAPPWPRPAARAVLFEKVQLDTVKLPLTLTSTPPPGPLPDELPVITQPVSVVVPPPLLSPARMAPPPKVPWALPPVSVNPEKLTEKLAATVGLTSKTRSATVCWMVVVAAPAPI